MFRDSLQDWRPRGMVVPCQWRAALSIPDLESGGKNMWAWQEVTMTKGRRGCTSADRGGKTRVSDGLGTAACLIL